MTVAIALTANDAIDASSVTTKSVTGVSIGVAASDRLVFVCISLLPGVNAATTTALTVGGVTATKAVSVTAFFADDLSIWWAAVPTGTTATVAATFSGNTGASTDFSYAVFRVTGANTSSPISSTNSADPAGTPASAPLTIPSLGGAIGWGGDNSGNPSEVLAWTNLTAQSNQAGPNNATPSSSAISTTNGSATRSLASPLFANVGIVLAAIKTSGGVTNQALSVAQGKAAQIRRSSVKLIAPSQGKTAALSRSNRRGIGVSQLKLAMLSRAGKKPLLIHQTKIASMSRGAVRPKPLIVAQEKLAFLAKQFAKTQVVLISQTKLATLGAKAINKALVIVQDKVASLAKGIPHRGIIVVQDKSAQLIKLFAKPMSITQNKIANIEFIAGKTKSFQISQGKIASVIRSGRKPITVSQAKFATLFAVRAFLKRIDIIQVKTATLRRRPLTPAIAVQVLKNVIVRTRIVKNVITRIRIISNVITRRSQ